MSSLLDADSSLLPYVNQNPWKDCPERAAYEAV